MKSETIISAVTSVTAKWCKQRKAEERNRQGVYRRRDAMTRSYRKTIKDAAWEVMEEAYAKASSDGRFPAHARQIMYAARPRILELADNCHTLDSGYFTQQLLPEYMDEHPETASWDVVFDARGHFIEPHTDRQVALGTLGVRKYLSEIDEHAVGPIRPMVGGNRTYPTCGPGNRYSAILFIEKEGFLPLFQSVRLAEKYDIAIMSTKGMSNTASRRLVDHLCADVPLLVLHDFDKAGFSILGTLQRDTRRFKFTRFIDVIDFGLRLEDVQQYGLQSEDYELGKSNPSHNLSENGATEEEIGFLCTGRGHGGYGHYVGRRVELNAFTSEDFIEWIESKLHQHDVEKVIPDAQTLEAAYRRAAVKLTLDKRLARFVDRAEAKADQMALNHDRIIRRVETVMKDDPTLSWDEAIADIVETELP